MTKTDTSIEIPMDIYDSVDELVIIVPIGGVRKETLEVYLEKTTLVVNGERKAPALKESLMPLQQECFWGTFSKTVQLPQNVYFEKIHTKLTTDNILIIVIPKVIIPEKVKLQIEYSN